ncbi:unnamed protein product [Pedinophyceae sp. YPF-701]|nr:unnamed protein product [Pedinophyceae sp. YPF-701]
MTAPVKHVRVLALPVFRQQWSFYAWTGSAEAAAGGAGGGWKEAAQRGSFKELLTFMRQGLLSKGNAVMTAQWEGLRESRPGTLKNRMFKLVQAVLSKEDPIESFLKQVPADEDCRLEVVYPSGYPERFIRRRMRLLARHEALHRSRRNAWGALTALLSPMAVTPIPNLPLYYAAYRFQSHRRALLGARTLKRAFATYDEARAALAKDEALALKLATQLKPVVAAAPADEQGAARAPAGVTDLCAKETAQGVAEGEGEGGSERGGLLAVGGDAWARLQEVAAQVRGRWVWGARAEPGPRRAAAAVSEEGVAARGEAEAEQAAQKPCEMRESLAHVWPDELLEHAEEVPVFTASEELGQLMAEECLLEVPLHDSTVLRIAEALGAGDGLMGVVARTRKKAVGAFFVYEGQDP